MAVSLNDVEVAWAAGGLGSFTHSYTVTANSDLILFLAFSLAGTSAASGVQYNGVAMSRVPNIPLTEGSGGTARTLDLWYLVNPSTGTHNFTGTLPAAAAGVGCGISFNGVSQAVPLGTTITNGGTSVNSLSATTNGSTSNDIVLAVMAARDSGAITIGGAQTQEWQRFDTVNCAGEGTIQAGGSSVTSTFSWTTADNGAMIAIPILNDSGGTPPPVIFTGPATRMIYR